MSDWTRPDTVVEVIGAVTALVTAIGLARHGWRRWRTIHPPAPSSPPGPPYGPRRRQDTPTESPNAKRSPMPPRPAPSLPPVSLPPFRRRSKGLRGDVPPNPYVDDDDDTGV